MSEERLLTAFKQYREAESKYDYFVVSVSAAVFAYCVQNYSPGDPEKWTYFVEPLALASLFGSVAFGILRLEEGVTVRKQNYVDIRDSEIDDSNMGVPPVRKGKRLYGIRNLLLLLGLLFLLLGRILSPQASL